MSQHEDLIETWHINNRVNLFLMSAIQDDAFEDKPPKMSGRTIKEMFAHIHNVRLMWLQPMNDSLARATEKIPTRSKKDKEAITRARLRESLTQSADLLAQAMLERLESGKISIFKPNPTAFIGYLIAHESYHRSEICMTLTQAGHPLDDDTLYGMWVWDKI